MSYDPLCLCPATSEYDPPCPRHGIRPIGQTPCDHGDNTEVIGLRNEVARLKRERETLVAPIARTAKDAVQRRCCVCGSGDMVSVSDPPKCMVCVGNRPQVEIDLATERWERRAEREAHNKELRMERAAKRAAEKLWSASDANNAALVSILHEISDALGHERGAVPGTPFSRLPELVRAALARGKAAP